MLKKPFFVVVTLLLVAAGYKFAVDNELISAQTLPKPIATVFDRFSLKAPEAAEQTRVLSSRAQEVASHTQQVLGTAIEAPPETAEKPLHERAVDYGRYVYCKQVVEAYEAGK